MADGEESAIRSSALEVKTLNTGSRSLYSWKISHRRAAPGPHVLLLHGATCGSKIFTPLARSLAAAGLHVVGMDFLGCGRSTGSGAEMSLQGRSSQAASVIDQWYEPDAAINICAFSMGGHTAVRLIGKLGARLKSLVLLAPACYAAEAEDVPFGSDFSTILRRQDSWLSSKAFIDASTFHGTAAVIVGENDQVIPRGVTVNLVSSFIRNSRAVHFNMLPDVGHNVLTPLCGDPHRIAGITRILSIT